MSHSPILEHGVGAHPAPLYRSRGEPGAQSCAEHPRKLQAEGFGVRVRLCSRAGSRPPLGCGDGASEGRASVKEQRPRVRVWRANRLRPPSRFPPDPSQPFSLLAWNGSVVPCLETAETWGEGGGGRAREGGGREGDSPDVNN